MQTLVLGAAGFLGINVVDALLEAGLTPRCGRRRRTNVIPLRRRKVPLVLADLDDPATLVEAMAGVDAVLHVAGHYPRDSRDPVATIATAERHTRHVLDAAAAAGVSRLVYVSSTATVPIRADGAPSTEADVRPEPPSAIGPYHHAKWLMETMVLDESRFEVAVAVPGACIGPWDLRVGTSALQVATANGLAPVHPDGIIQPVFVGDVARAVRQLAAMDEPPRRLLLAGPHLSAHAFLELLAERYGAPEPKPPLSAAQARALADSEEARVAGTAERPVISRAIVDLIVHGAPLDARLASEALGLEYTPLDYALDAFDAWARRFRIIPASKETHHA